MTDDGHRPRDPETDAWDVVVVGTGMGGSTLGYALARRGLRVLFVERGHFLFGNHERGAGRLSMAHDDSPDSRLERGWWPLPLEGRTSFGERDFFAPLGCGSGGTTGLYAAQLERFSPADLEPRRHHADVGDSSVPETWPIRYDELVPYYREAEALYRVTGTGDPLMPDERAALRTPPELSSRDAHLFASFNELGLHPYRAHCGFEFVRDCTECVASLCPHRCKSDAGRISLLPALERHGAKLLSDCEVIRLDADSRRVQGVRCRQGDREFIVSGKIVVLAAGAFMSPALLLRSTSETWPNGLANSSDQVGRNLMLHASDFVAVRPSKPHAETPGPKKALALNDFYLYEGQKLGTLQSVGIQVEAGVIHYHLKNVLQVLPRPVLKLLSPILRIVAYLAAFYFRRSHVFATILEDLPYARNRVVLDPTAKNGMRFEYHYPAELRARTHFFRRVLKTVLGKGHRLMLLSGEQNLNYGHVCGTCRFGDDPATSVLNRDNRAHDLENLYVVDASFFPSSGGTNPSLTIAANSLRVADVIARALSHPDG